MTLEEAIRTAIEYEIRVRDTYAEAMDEATDDQGRKIFKVLADEEQGHIDYLQSRLEEWQKNGAITAAELRTAVPSPEVIEAGLTRLQSEMDKSEKVYSGELKMLRRALNVEIETGNFYRQMVDELDGDGQRMFERFLEIEEGHRAVVQAEIDAVSGLGFWFDFPEFNLEQA
jgi:rubrerythrin